jgi:hypothetical protein
MGKHIESTLDALWSEYGELFQTFDDLTLARWMAQTLGQIEGRAWRLSHPLLGAYRLAAQVAHERQVWLKRLATPPLAYRESPCCRAPTLPLLTRDLRNAGLICQHCNETLVPLDELPSEIRRELEEWAESYDKVHAVAHWNDQRREVCPNYEQELEAAARKAEELLLHAGRNLAPKLVEYYPAIVWEDQDECLEVRPEDVLP